jgi:hypothetical protein
MVLLGSSTNAFDEIVRQKWNGVWFHGSRNFSQFLPIDEYQYKLIRSADFYQFIYKAISRKDNINFLIDSVLSVEKILIIDRKLKLHKVFLKPPK